MLVLRPGALGDTLLAVPALRALRRRFGPLTLAAHGGAARLLAALGEADRGVAFDDPSLGWLFGGDGVPEETAVVAWMKRVPALRHALVVAPSRPAGEAVHAARYLLETLAPLGVETMFDERPLRADPIVSREVMVHPGSGSAAKNWPAARFAVAIRGLASPVRMIVGEADALAAGAVEASLGYALPRLERPSLAELASRLAGCRAYLGNDSGVSHLAGLCGARTIVLFGPTSPAVWRPLGPDVHVASFDDPPGQVAALVEY
jgi:heptosyltransferase-3